MALPHYDNPSRIGQINAAGDDRALFLKLFAGEVLTAFQRKNVFMPLHRTRTISKGKSAQFPLTGYASAAYHTPGTMIDPKKVKHGERTVTVDDLLISSTFIAKIDEAMTHFDVRSIYSKEMGEALAKVADRNIARIIAKAALVTNATEAAAEFGTAFDDETYTNNVTIGAVAADATDGQKIVSALYKAKEEFVKKDIPHDDAVVVLPPEQYFALLNVADAVKATWLNRDIGGEGSVANAVVPVIAGFRIMMSNHIPNTDQSLASSDPEPITSSRTAAYRKNYAKIRGLIFTPDAAATVKLLDLAVESEYQIERQGTLMVAKYAMGHNVLRPACAIALQTV